MNVNHTSGKCSQKFALQDSHETGHHYQVHAGSPQFLDIGPLGLVVEFGPEFSRWNKLGRQAPFHGARQNSGLRNIAHHQCDFSGNRSARASIGNGRHIRAFARSKDAQTKAFLPIHPSFLTAEGARSQASVLRGGISSGQNGLAMAIIHSEIPRLTFMKTLLFLAAIFASFASSTRGQLQLNPGDSFSFSFNNLPKTGVVSVFGSTPGGTLQVTVNSGS